VIAFSLATISAPCTDVTKRDGSLLTNGDPGTGTSEPLLPILKPLINGESAETAKRNCWVEFLETVAAIGVGVGVGVGLGGGVVPGVGVPVGVGVGEGPLTTTLRGEMTHPTRMASNIHTPAMAQNSFAGS